MSATYWMRLEKDFMKKYYISEMRHRKNGNEIFALYMTMLTESIDHDGQLRSANGIPFSNESLMMLAFRDCILFSDSKQTVKDIKKYNEVVYDGLILFKEYGLIKTADDGTIIMTKLEDCIGTTSTERSRKCREKKKQDETSKATITQHNATLRNAACNTDMQQKCNEDKIKDKIKDKIILKEEISQEENLQVSKLDKKSIIEKWNEIDEIAHIDCIEHKRLEHVKARIEEKGFDKFMQMIENVKVSPFILGKIKSKDGKAFKATFDWCILPNNFQKVLDGNYIESSKTESAEEIIERRANAVGRKISSGY